MASNAWMRHAGPVQLVRANMPASRFRGQLSYCYQNGPQYPLQTNGTSQQTQDRHGRLVTHKTQLHHAGCRQRLALPACLLSPLSTTPKQRLVGAEHGYIPGVHINDGDVAKPTAWLAPASNLVKGSLCTVEPGLRLNHGNHQVKVGRWRLAGITAEALVPSLAVAITPFPTNLMLQTLTVIQPILTQHYIVREWHTHHPALAAQ